MNLDIPQLLSKQLRIPLVKVGHDLLSLDILIKKLTAKNTGRTPAIWSTNTLRDLKMQT